LYLFVQKSHYKTGNVRKLEAAIKLYGGLVQVYPEALEKLTSMLLHPFPKLRNHVADVLFVVKGVGKGVNWTKARKDDLRELKEELGLGEGL
jgi:tubulin-specific chaperone D